VRSPTRQRGYIAILGMLIAATAASSLIVAMARLDAERHRHGVSDREAVALAQFGVGLRGKIAAVQANPSLLPAGPQIGVDWLKAPGCGGLAGNPLAGHLPCDFTGGTLGGTYSTTFTRNPSTNFVEARTTFLVPILGGDPATRPIIAARLANAALAHQNSPLGGMFFEVWANVPPTATAPGSPAIPAGIHAGRVLMVAGNAPSNDIWLRTDGTNRMLADLNVGGNSLVNVNHAQLAGDMAVAGRARIRQGLQVTEGLGQFDRGIQTTDVMLTGLNRSVSQAIYDADVLTGAASYVVPKPDCSITGTAPAIYTSIQSTGTPPPNPGNPALPSDALYNAEVRVQDLGTSWLVTPINIGVSHGLELVGFDINLIRAYNQAAAPSMAIKVLRKCR